MSGPQVIEVVVIDSDINDTTEGEGEPDVTVNGKILRMVQAVDGNWYGYFADRDQALIADNTASGTEVTGLNFGTFCESNDNIAGLGTTAFTDTVGVAVPDTDEGSEGSSFITNGVPGEITGTTCDAGFTNTEGNVVREAKVPSDSTATDPGQIGLTDVNSFPFVQLYELTVSGNVVVQYNKGGGVQTTTLTFDTVENYADISLDRAVYPQGAEVHVTVTDLWLNIDPTDEDSWTFASNADGTLGTHYQVFDENGDDPGDTDANTNSNLTDVLADLMCEDNCVLIVNPNVQNSSEDVLTLQDNGDTVLENGDSLTSSPGDSDSDAEADEIRDWRTEGDRLEGQYPVTLTEQGPNSGVFGTYDEADTSVLVIRDDAKRGTSASIDYNETPTTILVGFDFATIDIQPLTDEWSSGEEIPVVIIDGDANKNSRSDEDLDLNDPSVDLIPALRTGDPFTMGEAGTEGNTETLVVFVDIENDAGADPSGGTALPAYAIASQQDNDVTVQVFSDRAIITNDENTAVDAVFIDFRQTVEDFEETFYGDESDVFNALNIDLRSLTTSGTWNAFLLIDNDNIIAEQDAVSGAPNVLNTEKTGDTTVVALTTSLSSQDLHVFSSTEVDTIDDALDAANDSDDIGIVLLNSQAAGFTPDDQ
jgi:hypothetical protein